MSNATKVKTALYRIVQQPIMRIIIGTLVCGIAMLVTNSLLRMVLGSEGDIVRIIRWVLSSIVLISTYYYFYRYYEAREITELKRQYFWRESLLGLIVGIGLISLVIFILYLSDYYTVRSVGKPSVLLIIFTFFVTSAVLEEVVFRGIVYRIIENVWGTKSALIVSALLFGAAHILNDHADVISIVSAASGGVFLGLLYSLKGRLWLPIAFHAGWNWAQASFGAVVSGNDDLPTFLDVKLTGPAFITGGPFGIENSIITVGLILLSSGIVASLLIKKQRVV